MLTLMNLSAEFDDNREALEILEQLGWIPPQPPAKVYFETVSKATSLPWHTAVEQAQRLAEGRWDSLHWLTLWFDGSASQLRNPTRTIELSEVLAGLSSLPFRIMAFLPIYAEWDYWVPTPDTPVRLGFGNAHLPIGWGAAFKGEAHEQRLASRRWLEHGPWKLHRAPNDVTLVQLHDLDADPQTAFEQVRVSFPRLCGGPWNGGGCISLRYQFPDHAPGDYMPAKRVLRIPILGTPPSHKDLLDAAAIRTRNALSPDRPVDEVIYAFADPVEAEAHKHRVWLYGHTVVTFIDGVETDITADYDPEPDPPEWVKRLDGV